MAKNPDHFMTDEEYPEWTVEGFTQAKPFSEVFPEQFVSWKNRGGRPPVESPKVHIGFRLAADVVEGVRATGKGYNARVERLLREALAKVSAFSRRKKEAWPGIVFSISYGRWCTWSGG